MLEKLQGAGALLNGDQENRLAGNLNVCFPGVGGKAISNSVSESIAISAGSACTTTSVEPSHVIMALGTARSTHTALLEYWGGTRV